jgi:UDP-N-acetylglucosamine transferase subunit ALG13
VLFSSLDWGLGHTTRSIPILKELINLNCDILIACNSLQKSLLKEEFPDLTYVSLSGYNIFYGRNKTLTSAAILLQLPKILIKINREKRWLGRILKQYNIDGIISDNRYGLYAPHIPSVFIIHQLFIKTGLGGWADRMAQRINYRFIKRFTTCWVPDNKGENALAGELSNPGQLPGIPVRYIGNLSRFTGCVEKTSSGDLLIILSGPEPQRSIFENKLIAELGIYEGKVTLVRGLPESSSLLHLRSNISVFNHLPAAQLNQMMCKAAIVISRPGYTTVMDLIKTGKKSILVPTPGQAEQEYLAQHLYDKRVCYCVTQTEFSLSKALESSAKFPYQIMEADMETYKKEVQEFVNALTV